MLDSILLNTPISSPLHPQANLPLLKGHLASKGFETKIIDSNILFFHWFLGENILRLAIDDIYKNPLEILSAYDNIENELWQKSKAYNGLHVGLRYLSMNYDRTSFDAVIKSLEDEQSNPFIDFYNQLIDEQFVGTGIKIVGIAVTFQDQIISAFTLADLLRKRIPKVKIVMGGQIITRCYKTMISHKDLCEYYDYLTLWEGEKNLVDIHRKVIRGENVRLVNTLGITSKVHTIERRANALQSDEIPSGDFSDINFNDYLFPEILVPLQTTRGCYGKCEFCAIPFGANSYRKRPVSAIIQEIIRTQEHILKQYGKKAVFFKFMEDTSSPALLYNLSVELEQRGLDAKWETFARLEKAFTQDGFMDQLFRGGCRKIHWGLESNDPSILKSMNKKITTSYSDEVLALAAEAGILNFCFILVGFPGETDEARKRLTQYVIENKNIHTLTVATFDLTRGSPMQQNFKKDNPYGMDMTPAEDFQVRLPYTINGENWKATIVPLAHKITRDIVKERPDIGFMTLFPDQIRSMYCERYTNKWGQIFLERYGEDNIKKVLVDVEKYITTYKDKEEIDPGLLPEPLRREHFRTKEDMRLIASAVKARKEYEKRRADQV